MGPFRKPIRRVFKSFSQGYETFRSTVLRVCSVHVSMPHSSLYQPVITFVIYVSPVRIPTETFPSLIPISGFTNASIRSFSLKLKTLKSSLSSHQKYAPTSVIKSPYSSDQDQSDQINVNSPPVTTLSISSHKISDRAHCEKYLNFT